jgi:hypothetical protein
MIPILIYHHTHELKFSQYSLASVQNPYNFPGVSSADVFRQKGERGERNLVSQS